MTNDSLIKAFDVINRNKEKKSFFHGNISEDLIEKAEKYLGLEFPKSYREFLLECGNGFFNGNEFYGICKDNFINSSVPDAIWLTMNERKECNLDKALILIKESMEYYYAIDTSRNNNGENPIIEIIPGQKKEESEIIADDFGTFFLNEIMNSIE